MLNGLKAEFSQTFALTTVVHNITKAEEGLARSEFLFCLANSGGHTEAETRMFVNLYLHARRTFRATMRSAAHG